MLISGPHLKRTYEIDCESEKNADSWIAAVLKQTEHKQAVSSSTDDKEILFFYKNRVLQKKIKILPNQM